MDMSNNRSIGQVVSCPVIYVSRMPCLLHNLHYEELTRSLVWSLVLPRYSCRMTNETRCYGAAPFIMLFVVAVVTALACLPTVFSCLGAIAPVCS